MIHQGMVAGAPFPDLLDWTWGELKEFIECRNEAQRNDLKLMALMCFRTAILINKTFNSQANKGFKLTEEYSFLWSDKELQDMAMEEFERKMMANVRAEDKKKYGIK